MEREPVISRCRGRDGYGVGCGIDGDPENLRCHYTCTGCWLRLCKQVACHGWIVGAASVSL